ncbi:LOW QUALITY PROTEIN: hypothetical protein OSB04_un000810 [Centaurea solstitialis]|uniref:Uncharacterized protein n=1 Tax=Centaurea solstitialis TaxID=347529 RepID=A0AA38VV59_9ASTR|nr:LOW QUALITY PROTEIN: hypothetical protein OSB04_un000810 [Centaurea solstitialis]
MSSCTEYPEVFPVDLGSLPPDRETELQICLNGRSDAYRQSIVSAGTGGDEIDDDAAARTGARCFSKIGMRSSYRQLKIRGEDCVTLFLDELILVSIDDILNYSRTAEELSNAWHEVSGCGFRTKDLETLSLRDEVSVYTNHEEPSVPVQQERVILRIGHIGSKIKGRQEETLDEQHLESERMVGVLGTLGASIKGAVIFWKAVMTSKACGYTSEDSEECARKPKYSVRPGANEVYRGLTYRRPGMKQDIAHFVERCVACFQVKIERQRPCGNCNSYLVRGTFYREAAWRRWYDDVTFHYLPCRIEMPDCTWTLGGAFSWTWGRGSPRVPRTICIATNKVSGSSNFGRSVEDMCSGFQRIRVASEVPVPVQQLVNGLGLASPGYLKEEKLGFCHFWGMKQVCEVCVFGREAPSSSSSISLIITIIKGADKAERSSVGAGLGKDRVARGKEMLSA